MGEWYSLVIGIKEGMYCMVYWVLYASNESWNFILFYFKDFIYLFDRDRDSQREREHSRGSGRGRSRLIAEEPDVGLDPTTLGSRPEPKADA